MHKSILLLIAPSNPIITPTNLWNAPELWLKDAGNMTTVCSYLMLHWPTESVHRSLFKIMETNMHLQREQTGDLRAQGMRPERLSLSLLDGDAIGCVGFKYFYLLSVAELFQSSMHAVPHELHIEETQKMFRGRERVAQPSHWILLL